MGILGGEPASAKAPNQGMWLEYPRNCDEDSVGDSEQGTERQGLIRSVPGGMGSPKRVLSRR